MIERFEVDKSAHFAAWGFEPVAVFQRDRAQKLLMPCRTIANGALRIELARSGVVALDREIGDQSNPSAYRLDATFAQFAVVKLELLKHKPAGIIGFCPPRVRELKRSHRRLAQ